LNEEEVKSNTIGQLFPTKPLQDGLELYETCHSISRFNSTIYFKDSIQEHSINNLRAVSFHFASAAQSESELLAAAEATGRRDQENSLRFQGCQGAG